MLEPQAEMHNEYNVALLKKNADQVRELVGKIPAECTHELRPDLDIAVKGILSPRKAPVKKPKPELVMDDDDYEDL